MKSYLFRPVNYYILVLLFIYNPLYSQNDESSAFFINRGEDREWISYSTNHDALYQIISNEALKHLEIRKNHIATLHTKSDWREYQSSIRQKLSSSLSRFKKSPLNPEITGKIERDNFTIEKIIYESHPSFYVTACLFLPKERQNPAPAIIYCSGHSPLSFRSKTYQHTILNLVQKGFIVLAYDPIGQGERMQYLNLESGQSFIGSPTREHSYAGVQTLFSGTSLTDYFIWDGIRAVDYLSTRPEVDMNRVGITGRSGGGTQTAMIAAIDERIYAAAPECYTTNFTRLFQSIGPQDAEQNPYLGIAKGIDHPDFFHARAPKPSLIISTINDYFSIQGARETFEEVKKSYSAFEMTENIQMTEDLGKHESTLKNRMAMYDFFLQHLKLPGNNQDIEIETLPENMLRVTKSGQIASSKKGETVYSLNKELFSKKSVPDSTFANQVAKLSGIELNRTLTSSVFTGKLINDDICIEKYLLENQMKDFVIPVYVASKKDIKPKKLLVWMNPNGKIDLFKNEIITDLIKQEYTIITADLPGIGELHNPDFTGDATIKQVPFNYYFGANLVGKSIVGIQAEAFDLLIQFINEDYRFNSKKINALIEGSANAFFLHYTALKNPFEKSVIVTDFTSEEELIFQEYYNPQEAFYIVPGSLSYYKLRDLLTFHSKSSYKVIQPAEKPYSKNIKTEIIDFL